MDDEFVALRKEDVDGECRRKGGIPSSGGCRIVLKSAYRCVWDLEALYQDRREGERMNKTLLVSHEMEI